MQDKIWCAEPERSIDKVATDAIINDCDQFLFNQKIYKIRISYDPTHKVDHLIGSPQEPEEYNG